MKNDTSPRPSPHSAADCGEGELGRDAVTRKEFRCEGCGDVFEYTRRRPKYCPECRKIKLNAQIQRYKKGIRKGLKKGDKEEKFTGKSSFLAQVGGASHAEIARVLNINKRQVEELERQVLMKIRTNPELKNLWGTLKEELADGAVLAEGVMGSANKGNLLLDYQLAVADWWQIHDDIVEQGCTAEALECLGEIEQFQRKIAESLLTL